MSRYEFTPTGWYAESDPKRSAHRGWLGPVEAWSPEGNALVVERNQGRLVVARTQEGFSRLEPCRTVVGVIAAEPGWRVRHVDPPEPPTISAVIAWVACMDGEGEPFVLPMTTATGWARGAIADVDRDENVTLLAPDTPDSDSRDPSPSGSQL